MRRIEFEVILLLGVSLPCFGEEVVSDRLLDALAVVESNNDCNAVGDKENAVGILQIWPIMVKDVNRISGKSYTLKDRYSKQKSYEMCRIFLNNYCKNMSDYNKSRCWNGGATGYKKKSTIKYGQKVMAQMRKGIEK